MAVLTNSSGALDMAAHPGFHVQPPAWCVDPAHRGPVNTSFSSVNTSAALAAALLRYSALGHVAASVAFAATFMPAVLVIEQDMAVAEVVVRLAALEVNGSISLGMPLMVSGPPFPVTLGEWRSQGIYLVMFYI